MEALVLHTSGTTSRPKVVPLTQSNLVASNFKKYALDFIVVFLGISVSFGLNNLNEKR